MKEFTITERERERGQRNGVCSISRLVIMIIVAVVVVVADIHHRGERQAGLETYHLGHYVKC